MSKIIIVTDKGTLKEIVYLDIKKLDFGYSGLQVVEYIITDRRGAIHHYDEYSDYIERVLKENNARVVTPRDRLLMKGNYNDSDC